MRVVIVIGQLKLHKNINTYIIFTRIQSQTTQGEVLKVCFFVFIKCIKLKPRVR